MLKIKSPIHFCYAIILMIFIYPTPTLNAASANAAQDWKKIGGSLVNEAVKKKKEEEEKKEAEARRAEREAQEEERRKERERLAQEKAEKDKKAAEEYRIKKANYDHANCYAIYNYLRGMADNLPGRQEAENLRDLFTDNDGWKEKYNGLEMKYGEPVPGGGTNFAYDVVDRNSKLGEGYFICNSISFDLKKERAQKSGW